MTKEEIKILQEQSQQNDRYNSLMLALRVAFDEIQRLHEVAIKRGKLVEFKKGIK